jgi:L-rhamnonate dehydratase
MRISAYADAHRIPVVPHGSSVYSYHYAATRPESPFTEFLVMHPDGTEVTPMFTPLLVDEPVPVGGRLAVSRLELPGFGIVLNPDYALQRPFPR